MADVGSRCDELRIDDEEQTWRIIHHVDPDAVVIVEGIQQEDADARHVVQTCVDVSYGAMMIWLEDRMDEARRRKLESAGWRVGSAAEFLDLSEDEAVFVEVKLTLSEELRDRRQEQGLSQVELARRLGSSQSRIAKMGGQ